MTISWDNLVLLTVSAALCVFSNDFILVNQKHSVLVSWTLKVLKANVEIVVASARNSHINKCGRCEGKKMWPFFWAYINFVLVGETLQPQSRQLEFEDVWLASQVEPLQDNFNVLGKSSDEISEGEVSKETVVPCRWGEGRGGQQDNWLLCKAATVREVLKPTFRALLLYQNERRMDARNVSSRRNSLRWSIFIINSVYKTKFSCYTPLPTQHHSFFRNLPLYLCLGKLLLVSSFLF